MIKILISGEIGWDVMPFMIREQLDTAKGGDIEVYLSSPGGSVFEGIEIFNMFREYKRENPDAQMILNIKSEAASMGSYIAANESFDLVTVEDNATHMRHNPIMGVYGDYQEMKKGADFLERLAIMMAPVYANRSGQTMEDARSDMDSETWLFGKEIVDAGFADELIKTKSTKNKASSIASAELKLKNVMTKVRETEIKKDDFDKAYAMMKEIEIPEPAKIEPAKQPAISGKNNQEEKSIMNIDELKKEHPEIHAEAMLAGVDQEKERVNSLLEMKSKKDFEGIPEISDRIEEGIKNGETINAVEIGVMAILKTPGKMASVESPGDIDTGEDLSISGEIQTDDVKSKIKKNSTF